MQNQQQTNELGALIFSYSFTFKKLGRKDPSLGTPILREIANQPTPLSGETRGTDHVSKCFAF